MGRYQYIQIVDAFGCLWWIKGMVDKLEIRNQQDAELKRELDKINWNLDYGSIKIQIRQGKPTLITIERTIKLD